MDKSSTATRNQSNEFRSENELPNPLSNDVLENLFGSSFDGNAAAPPRGNGAFNPLPSEPLLEMFGTASVNNDDLKKGPGNEPEGTLGFTVASDSFQPQWNGPPEIELTNQHKPTEDTSGDCPDMIDKAFDSVQSVLIASPSPVISPLALNSCIADPRDPLQQVFAPRIMLPKRSTLANQGQQNTAATPCEQRNETSLQFANSTDPGRSRSSLKRLRPASIGSNDEHEEFPTNLQSDDGDDHFSVDEAMGDSGGDEDYQLADEDNQPSEIYIERDTENNENQELQCPICKLKVGDKDALQRHQSRTHASSGKKFRCDNCNGTFVSLVNLERHVNNVHTGSQEYRCNLCTATFSTQRSLCNHKGKEHRDVPPEQGGPKRKKRRATGKVYKCSLCTYSSNQQFNVRRHFLIVHEKRGYFQCTNRGCGRICMSRANYKTHTMTCRKRPNKR